MNRQRLTLFILVIIFGLAAVWSYRKMPQTKTIDSLVYKQGEQAKPLAAATADKPPVLADDGTKLNLSLLDEEQPDFKGYRRNIFRPIFVGEIKIAREKARPFKMPPPIAVAPPSQPVNIVPEAVPLARFTFLGFLKSGSTRTIFLGKDNDILLVKAGDKIAGRYEATEISDQALTLTVTDTGDKIVIPLLENQPLVSGR